MKDIGKMILERRELLKLTQKDLAEMSGITSKTIYKIENGVGEVTLETVEKLCVVLGLEVIIRPKTS